MNIVYAENEWSEFISEWSGNFFVIQKKKKYSLLLLQQNCLSCSAYNIQIQGETRKKNNNNKISVTTDNNHVLFTQTRITTTKSTTALVGHEQYMCVVRLCQCAHHMHCTRTLHSYTHTQWVTLDPQYTGHSCAYKTTIHRQLRGMSKHTHFIRLLTHFFFCIVIINTRICCGSAENKFCFFILRPTPLEQISARNEIFFCELKACNCVHLWHVNGGLSCGILKNKTREYTCFATIQLQVQNLITKNYGITRLWCGHQQR